MNAAETILDVADLVRDRRRLLGATVELVVLGQNGVHAESRAGLQGASASEPEAGAYGPPAR